MNHTLELELSLPHLELSLPHLGLSLPELALSLLEDSKPVTSAENGLSLLSPQSLPTRGTVSDAHPLPAHQQHSHPYLTDYGSHQYLTDYESHQYLTDYESHPCLHRLWNTPIYLQTTDHTHIFIVDFSGY